MVEQERISALMDGELDEAESGTHLRRVGSEDDLHECWQTYHLIGDVLRGESELSTGFAGRLRTALEAEPTVLAPQRRVSRTMNQIRVYALSAAATVAGVAVVGWLAVQQNDPVGERRFAQIGGVSIPSAMPVATSAQAQADDPEVDDYVRVHQEFSPSGAMHGLPTYVRTISSSR